MPDRRVVDEFVIRIARHDDAMAYKQLFCLYYSSLLQFSYSITRLRESAEEVVSDVFLKIWNSRRSLLKIENFPLYLYISVKNQSINYLEKQHRQRSFSIDEMDAELKSIYLDPEQLLITSEMMIKIRQAIDALPTRCRLIFKLIKEDGLRYKEVAELLNVSIKTIENQMTIALKRIDKSIHFDITKTVSSSSSSK